jgi:hypothetical protein
MDPHLFACILGHLSLMQLHNLHRLVEYALAHGYLVTRSDAVACLTEEPFWPLASKMLVRVLYVDRADAFERLHPLYQAHLWLPVCA